jgi:hypothetical protein
MRRKAANTIGVVLALAAVLAACEREAGNVGVVELDAAQQARAQALYAQYESARGAGNAEAAERAADELRDRFADSEAASKLDATLDAVRAQAAQAREARRLRGLWDYQAIAVDGGTQRSASLFNRTVEAGEDAPAPIPDAQLVLRDHPSWGRSAYLLLAQRKFDCGKPCMVRIAFDGAAAREWRGKQADSGKGPALFIEDQAAFERALAGAKEVRIELPKDSGRIPALVFEVGGYAPERYASP